MRNKIINRANELVGYTRNEIGCAGTYAWCADTVSKILEYCGITGVSSKSCNEMYRLMTKSSEWNEPETYPEPGDVILFDWNNPANPDPDEDTLPLDHVGIVVEFDDASGLITYVNGNGNSSTYVTKQTINVSSRYVSYWMRYIGSSDTVKKTDNPATEAEINVPVSMPVIKLGSKGSAVKTMQALLTAKFKYTLPKYGCDSDFGAESNSVLKKFQSDKGLVADGICGAKTWEALLK